MSCCSGSRTVSACVICAARCISLHTASRSPGRAAAMARCCHHHVLLGNEAGRDLCASLGRHRPNRAGIHPGREGKVEGSPAFVADGPCRSKILESRHRDQGQPTEGWVLPSSSKSGHLEQGSSYNQHVRAIEIVNNAAAEEAANRALRTPQRS